MDYVFSPSPVASLPIVGDARHFAVRRIFCVGRNYAAHAAEMGVAVDRDAPFYFTKPASAVVHSGSVVPYPPGTKDMHHEVELVVAIGDELFKQAPQASVPAIFGYAVGLDLTRRDLQAKSKEKRHPWDTGKAFENSAPIGAISRAAALGPLEDRVISLDVNGERRQHGRLGDMVWSVAELLADLSRLYHLMPGDIVMTGTPSGVGALHVGDRLVAQVDGLSPLEIEIGPAS